MLLVRLGGRPHDGHHFQYFVHILAVEPSIVRTEVRERHRRVEDLLLRVLTVFGHDVLERPLVVLQAGAQLAILHLDEAQVRMLLMDGMHHLVVGLLPTDQVERLEVVVHGAQAVQLLANEVCLAQQRVGDAGAFAQTAGHLFGVGNQFVGVEGHLWWAIEGVGDGGMSVSGDRWLAGSISVRMSINCSYFGCDKLIR